MEKEFWRRITHDEIITDYNTKAVNVDAYQRRDNNSDTAGKGYKRNPTTDEQEKLKSPVLFDPLCCRERIISYYRRAVFIFAPNKPSWAKPTFTRYIF